MGSFFYSPVLVSHVAISCPSAWTTSIRFFGSIENLFFELAGITSSTRDADATGHAVRRSRPYSDDKEKSAASQPDRNISRSAPHQEPAFDPPGPIKSN